MIDLPVVGREPCSPEGCIVWFSDPRVADDDDDTPDQGRRRGYRRLTQLEAAADALNES
jgi:hypothetical protein